MQTLIDIVTGLVHVTSGMADAFRPFVVVIVDFFRTLAAGGPEAQESIGKILAFSMAIQGAGLAFVAAILAIDEYKLSVTGLFNVLAGGVTVLWNGFQILLSAIQAMTIIVAGLFVQLLDNLTFGLLPGLDGMKAKLTEWGSTIGPVFEKNGAEAAAGLAQLTKGLVQLGSESGTSKEKAKDLHKGLLELPAITSPKIEVTGGEESKKSVEAFGKVVKELPAEQKIGIVVEADGTTIETTKNTITKTFPDGTMLITNIGTQADAAKLAETKKKIDEAIPKDKLMEIQAKLDVEKIKAAADIVSHAIEWKAKLDIAGVEANVKIIEASFKSIDNTITSSGTTLSAMVSAYLQALASGQGGASVIEDQMRRENERRDDALKMQKELVAAEIANLKARTDALSKGDAMITINGAGLQPHLESFMFEILSAIQVRASAEGQKFLVG
jgi:hypothetical protein